MYLLAGLYLLAVAAVPETSATENEPCTPPMLWDACMRKESFSLQLSIGSAGQVLQSAVVGLAPKNRLRTFPSCVQAHAAFYARKASGGRVLEPGLHRMPIMVTVGTRPCAGEP